MRQWQALQQPRLTRRRLFFQGCLPTTLLCLLALTACDFQYPRDPKKTLETVLEQQRIVVAVIDHPPWVIVPDAGDPRGAEVELVESFAAELGVEIDWRPLPSFTALRGLSRGDIDLVIGGLEQPDVQLITGAGTTYSYFEERFVIGVRQGHPLPEALDGQAVFVPPEEPLSILVRKQGGRPTDQMSAEVVLAALPHWDLQAHGLQRSSIVLRRAKHVMAVPEGENAWLMRLERLLRAQAADFDLRLREHRE